MAVLVVNRSPSDGLLPREKGTLKISRMLPEQYQWSMTKCDFNKVAVSVMDGFLGTCFYVLFLEAIPSSGIHYMVWDIAPIEITEQSIFWSSTPDHWAR